MDSVETSSSRKRNRNELECSISDNQPASKKIKVDPVATMSKFITDIEERIQPSNMINSINAITDLINQRLVFKQLINSWFKIQRQNRTYSWAITHITLLSQIVVNIKMLSRAANLQLLTCLKQFLIFVLDNGADHMLKQDVRASHGEHDRICIVNSTPPSSNSVFQQLSSDLFKDVKYDLYLFTDANLDVQISIFTISARRSPWCLIRNNVFYFADHIDRECIRKEFTLDIGTKALCWFDLIFVHSDRSWWDHQGIMKTDEIENKNTVIRHINYNAKNSTLDNVKCAFYNVWLLHLFILKEYSKIYPIQFEQCFIDIFPMDIVHILKKYCIPEKDYSWLDAQNDNIADNLLIVQVDENVWVKQYLCNIYRLGSDWRTVFYQIVIQNKDYIIYHL